jgi:hypothetical protein
VLVRDRTVELGEIVLLENLVPLDVHDDDSTSDTDESSRSRQSVDMLSPTDGISSLAMALRDSAIEDGSGTPTAKSPSRKSSFTLSRKGSFSLRSRNSSQDLRAEEETNGKRKRDVQLVEQWQCYLQVCRYGLDGPGCWSRLGER